MASSHPIVRQVKWIFVIPQLVIIGLAIFIFYLIGVEEPLLYGALTIVLISLTMKIFIPKMAVLTMTAVLWPLLRRMLIILNRCFRAQFLRKALRERLFSITESIRLQNNPEKPDIITGELCPQAGREGEKGMKIQYRC